MSDLINTFFALFAILPLTRMIFIKMLTAQCVSMMISVTAIPSVSQKDILIFIIAYPLFAAFRFGQLLVGSTKPAGFFLFFTFCGLFLIIILFCSLTFFFSFSKINFILLK